MSNETEKSKRMKKISDVLEYDDLEYEVLKYADLEGEVLNYYDDAIELIGKQKKLNLIYEWIEAGITRSDDGVMKVDEKVIHFLNFVIQSAGMDNSYSDSELILNQVDNILLKADASILSEYVNFIRPSDELDESGEIEPLDSEKGIQHQKVYK